MSTLASQQIRALAISKQMISPFLERGEIQGKTFGLGPTTYDFRCKQSIILMPTNAAWRFRFYKAIDWFRGWFGVIPLNSRYHLGFALVSTVERVRMPNDVCATVMDKSSWAREGLAVQNTHFDPGFEGFPTIELTNHGHRDLVIRSGVPICQFKFEKLDEPTEMPYRGRYQNQPDRPVLPKEGRGAWGDRNERPRLVVNGGRQE